MINYEDDKLYIERDELNYIRDIDEKNEFFSKENIKSVNVSINFIDYYYIDVTKDDINNVKKYNFVEYESLKNSKESDLYSRLKQIDKELKNKDISKEQLSYLKYLSNNIKKYLSKKREYDEYYDIFFPKILKLDIK